jgi:hypothetical protein
MINSIYHAGRVILLAAWCASCAPSDNRDEVVGNYRMDYTFGIEELRLLDNGQYQQTFQLAGDATRRTATGKWDFKRKDYPLVYLYDSMMVTDGQGNLRKDYGKPVPGPNLLLVRKNGGIVYLVFNIDLNLSLKKQMSSN